MPDTGDLNALFGKLNNMSQEKVAKLQLKKAGTGDAKVDAALGKLQDAINSEKEITREHLANIQAEMANADFSSIEKDHKQSTADFTEAVKILLSQWAVYAQSFEDVSKPNEDDLAVVRDAEARLKSAQQRLASAKQRMVDTNTRLRLAEEEKTEAQARFFLWRGPAVKAAKAKIADIESDIARAQLGIDQAEAQVAKCEADIPLAMEEAERLAKKRLDDNDLQQSYDHLVKLTLNLKAAIDEGIANSTEEARALFEKKRYSLEGNKKATVLKEEREKEARQLEVEIKEAKEILSTYEKNSSEWVEQQGKVDELEQKLIEVNGQRNNALSLAQEFKKFTEILSETLKSTAEVKTVLFVASNKLQTGVDHRNTMISARMNLKKEAEKIAVAAEVAKLGSEYDQDHLDEILKTRKAATDAVVEMVERYPEELERIYGSVKAANAEYAKQEARIRSQLEGHDNDYGLDKFGISIDIPETPKEDPVGAASGASSSGASPSIDAMLGL